MYLINFLEQREDRKKLRVLSAETHKPVVDWRDRPNLKVVSYKKTSQFLFVFVKK